MGKVESKNFKHLFFRWFCFYLFLTFGGSLHYYSLGRFPLYWRSVAICALLLLVMGVCIVPLAYFVNFAKIKHYPKMILSYTVVTFSGIVSMIVGYSLCLVFFQESVFYHPGRGLAADVLSFFIFFWGVNALLRIYERLEHTYSKEIKRLVSEKQLNLAAEQEKVDFVFKIKCVNNEVQNLKLKDIIYFQARGKHTVISTVHGDFESITLLKDLYEASLADNFLRVHKSYVVNLLYISTLKYFSGGSYMLLLSDQDETMIPIGRTYLNNVRQTLNPTK